MKQEDEFQVSVKLDDKNFLTTLHVTHADEAFNFEFNGNNVSIINNGDNSWSVIEGNVEQETINIIGEAIEQHYQDESI